MALIWKTPLALPSSGASAQQFELQRIDYAAPEGGGRVGGVQAGIPLWSGVWNIGTIARDKSDELRAFLLRLRGSQRRFLGRDLARPYPKAHITGFTGLVRAGTATPFDGSASTWSESSTLDGDFYQTLTGLPAGLVLSPGDYIDYRWNSSAETDGVEWRALQRVVVGDTATGAGSATPMVEPPLPSVVPSTAVAHLDNPACVMALIVEKSSLEGVDRRLAVRGGTITGIQDLRP